ncbi:unnamed protein product [Chrysoparadoxa australica]
MTAIADAAAEAAATEETSCRFQAPRRAIYTLDDMKKFLASETYKDILGFVLLCNQAVMGKTVNESEYKVSEAVKKISAMMGTMESWIDEYPPIQQPMRFGNKAFRSWHGRFVEEAPAMMRDLLPENLQEAATELLPYLLQSFGNEQRIDYGTGHETNFVTWMHCLYKIKLLSKEDLCGAVFVAFNSYLKTMRRLNVTYMLEPAGSHGVWGLDDYHCLPFLWGSAQLSVTDDMPPNAVHDDNLLELNKANYLYFDAVHFVKELKTGAPFGECCPMLNDISALPNWKKVNLGMVKLYEGEVLSKFPAIQHFLFGSLLPATFQPSSPPRPVTPPLPPNFDPFVNAEAPWAHGDAQTPAQVPTTRVPTPGLWSSWYKRRRSRRLGLGNTELTAD